MLGPIKNIKAKVLPMLIDDVDTDRIIPARFLRCVTFEGLGDNVFIDERYIEGKQTDHPMNKVCYSGAKIILSGKNFGCGSSREHAPQAIKRAGFSAVIAESFAEIFLGNSSVLGLVCLVMSKNDIVEIASVVEKTPNMEVSINIEILKVTVANKTYDANMKANQQKALVEGSYDTLAELIQNKKEVDDFRQGLAYLF